jgi:two-component system, chemotaxis family, protein-glutamate methylesterase/glutaminase
MVVAHDSSISDMLCDSIKHDPSLILTARCASVADCLEFTSKIFPDVIVLDMQLFDSADLAVIGKMKVVFDAAIVAISAIMGIALQTLDAGAIEFVYMPEGGSDSDMIDFSSSAIEKIKMASSFKTCRYTEEKKRISSQPHLIAVACSEGGAISLANIIKNLPDNYPAMLVMQWNSDAFSSDYTGLLSRLTGKEVKQATDDMRLVPGSITVMKAGEFYGLEKANTGFMLRLHKDNIQTPNGQADTFFQSAAMVSENKAIGILLSSGSDGEQGLRYMALQGALAIKLNKNALLREIDYIVAGGIIEMPLEDVTGEINALFA